MAENLRASVAVAGLVAAGLQAGTYYVWACGVMPGLARTDDHTFVNALNGVNQAIVNPVFMASFLGTPILAAAALVTSTPAARPWTIAGLICAVGTVAVTAAGNVPLNNALAATTASPAVGWNVVRTLTATAAVVALGLAALRS
jgi:uncharacterized membrane protein